MNIKYKYIEVSGRHEFDRTGTHIITDYVNYPSNDGGGITGIDERIERLSLLIGNVLDKLGVDILSVIDPQDLRNTYKRKD